VCIGNGIVKNFQHTQRRDLYSGVCRIDAIGPGAATLITRLPTIMLLRRTERLMMSMMRLPFRGRK